MDDFKRQAYKDHDIGIGGWDCHRCNPYTHKGDKKAVPPQALG